MSDPEPLPRKTPVPPAQSAEKRPLVITPRYTRRDIITTIVIVVTLVGFIVLAILYSTQPPKNTLRGVVQGKHSTGERETLLDVGRRGVSSKTVDTGYYLKIFVAAENRAYDVIVEKELWEKKKEGDTMEFLRPPDEQRY